MSAFTVIELIVVIGIIAALMIISLPALKGISQSHTVSSASQQLMDDLALARQYAMNNRSVVHVLFVPPEIANWQFSASTDLAKRLMAGPFTTYAIYAQRTVGDQPGRPNPRYLSKWKALPDGVFIPPREFNKDLDPKDWEQANNPLGRPFLQRTKTDFPFPTLAVQNVRRQLPHIAFSPNGSLFFEDDAGVRMVARDEVIELARGSVMASRDDTGALISFDVRESPPNNSINNYNRIRIDGLTGRCTLERPEIP